MAREWLTDLEVFARREADSLTSDNYGIGDLATAPVRLFGIFVKNAIGTASMLSDNLALLSLTGRYGAPTAKRKFRVYVQLPAAGTIGLKASALVGRLTKYDIPAAKIHLDPHELDKDGTVDVTVHCAAAPSDIYAGALYSDGAPNWSQEVQVAIDEFGIPVQ